MSKKCLLCSNSAVIVRKEKIPYCKACYTKVEVERAKEEMHIPIYKLR